MSGFDCLMLTLGKCNYRVLDYEHRLQILLVNPIEPNCNLMSTNLTGDKHKYFPKMDQHCFSLCLLQRDRKLNTSLPLAEGISRDQHLKEKEGSLKHNWC